MKYIYSKRIKLLLVLLLMFLISFIQTYSEDINLKPSKKDKVIEEYSKNKAGLNYESDALVVKLESSSNNEIKQLEQKYSAKAEKIAEDIYTIKFDVNKYTIDEMLANLNNENIIEYAEPNYYFELAASPTTEPSYNQQWALEDSNYGIDLIPVWDQISSNDQVVVAVVDSGVKYDHPDLDSNIWVNSGEVIGNSIDDDNNGYIDDYYGWNFADNNNQIMDTNGHGTHVAGIIGAEINDIGIAGVVPNVKMMPLKVISSDGYIYLDKVINAINYATSKGVKIFNLSFGGDTFVQSFNDLLDSKDALFICAAGNGGSDQIGDNNDTTPFYPASYDLDNIISVAATDNNGNLASFSNYGVNSVDVAAPGLNIYSTYNVGDYYYLSGTSMAAPFVTASAAILYGSDSNASIDEIRNDILNSSKGLANLNGKVNTSGLIDIKQSYTNFMNIVEFDSGDGSFVNPYIISNARQLNAVRNNLAASYKLAANIDLSGYAWIPIGSSSEPFNGTFDGAGYEISNLNIELPNDSYIGLFGYVTNTGANDPNIFNLKLSVDSISGNSYIGSLIGYGVNVNLSELYITTNITTSLSSQGNIGGIIGYADNSSIDKTSVSGIINGIGSNIGGIVGYLKGDITYSYNEANIYGNTYTGGIAGYTVGSIQDVYNLGSISGDSTLTNSGGIAGYIEGDLTNSYCLGIIKVDFKQTYTNVGLLVGSNSGNITNSYYYNPFNFVNNDLGSSITIDNLYNESTYTGFNFTDNWEIGTNTLLPVLKNLNFIKLDDFSLSSEVSVDINDDSKFIDIQTSPTTNNRKNFLYTSQDTNIALVDEFGNIKPVSEGTTIIDVYSLELNTFKSITINVTYNVKGDLNNDHLVTTTDLVILRRYLAGLTAIDDKLKGNADINGDASITTTDLVRMRRYLAGLEGM